MDGKDRKTALNVLHTLELYPEIRYIHVHTYICICIYINTHTYICIHTYSFK